MLTSDCAIWYAAWHHAGAVQPLRHAGEVACVDAGAGAGAGTIHYICLYTGDKLFEWVLKLLSLWRCMCMMKQAILH